MANETIDGFVGMVLAVSWGWARCAQIMRLQDLQKGVRWWCAGVGFLLLAACSGEVTPPAPPAELPSALTFPQGLTIDVSSIQGSQASLSPLALVGSGGTFSQDISMGAEMVTTIQEVADGILSDLSTLEITIGSTTTTYQTSLNSSIGPQGSTITQHFKVDFAPFDYNNDGTNESCSGHTGTTPICFRIWYASTAVGATPSSSDFFPVMAGVFDSSPTDTNPGAGRFKLRISEDFGADNAGASEQFLMGMIYDHRDSENKFTEAFGQGDTSLVDSGDQSEGTECRLIDDGHVKVSQVGPDATATKTVLETSHFPADPNCQESGTFEQYLGRFKEGNNFWIGSVNREPAGNDFTDVCAEITTGNQTSSTNCTSIGLSLDDLDFLDTATSSDYGLPTDFPTTPTF